MRLPPGSTLASYQILGPLGAGAMGEVYRAKDTRLGREVAIKVLPPHFAEEEERLRRFEREAKTLASLNHPNVAQIFGVDQVGDTCFLVLELVPGETLEERLKRGALSIAEALDVCKQIAEGLEAAHEAGVIHRDLKPANVRITPEGKLKVLDFGLAKPTNESDHGSSTDSALSTEAGRLLGTPTYMAPEQARGKPIDKRVDVWALGCVLFECLAGTRAFAGETPTDVIGAVLHTEPDYARLPSELPQRLRELIADCLVKDPRERPRDAGEVRRQLGHLRTGSPGVRSKKRMSVAAAVSVAIAASVASSFAGLLAASLLQGNSRSSAGAPPTRFTVSLPDAVKRPGDGIQGIALSPDSRSLAISASTEHGGIYLREFAQLESRLLAGTETASDLCFSPDGRSIAYFGLDVHSLRRVTLDGGMPQVIRQQLYEAGFAWSPEGFIAIESPGDHGALSALDLATGRSTPLTRVDKPGGDTNHASPCFLPGARAMFYTVWTGVDGAQGRIDLLDLDTHEQRTVERDATTPRYLPFSEREGALLYHRSDAFWARRFDPRTKQCQGEEVLLIAGGIQLDPNIGEAMLDVSATGTLAYQPRIEGYGQSQLFWVTRDGQEELVTPERLDHQTPSLSADGKLLAFTRGGATPRVYVTDLRPPLDERAPRRVNVEQGISGGCVLSPDGARVVYLSGSNATLKVCVQDLAGDKPPRVIFEGDAMPRSWSRDGLWIAMMGPGPSGAEVKVAPADGSAPARPFVQVKGNAYDPQFSPDGQSLAYVSDEDGLAEVYVAVFPGGSRRAQVTNGGGASPRWSDDGRELYFRKSDEYCVVPVARLPEFSFGTPRILFKGEYDTSFFSNGFLPAPDGRFLLNKPLLPGDRVLRVIVVERFAEEVQTKLATVAAH